MLVAILLLLALPPTPLLFVVLDDVASRDGCEHFIRLVLSMVQLLLPSCENLRLCWAGGAAVLDRDVVCTVGMDLLAFVDGAFAVVPFPKTIEDILMGGRWSSLVLGNGWAVFRPFTMS